MSMTETSVTRPASLPAMSLTGLFSAHPLFLGASVALLLSMVPVLAAMVLDDRQFNGVNIWDKPFKFQVALSVYLLTLAFFERFVPFQTRQARWYRWHGLAVVGAVTLEMIWIAGAAANGMASHFNVTDPVLASVYGFMGFLAVLLTSATLVQGLAIRANRETGLSPVLHHSIWIGLVMTFVLTVPVAGTMSSQTGHLVGGNLSDAEGLALIGWARDGGDLRVAHFLATHAMHAIPVFGLMLAWFGRSRDRTSVTMFAALFAALVVFTLLQAMAGRPFLGWLG